MAVEIPEGIFNVVGEWRYSGMAAQWWLWELDAGEGQTRLLARVDNTCYCPHVEKVGEFPSGAVLDFEGTQFALHDHGEARVERSAGEAHDFWRARFQIFSAPGKILVFTEDRGDTHRMAGEELDAKLVQVYQS